MILAEASAVLCEGDNEAERRVGNATGLEERRATMKLEERGATMRLEERWVTYGVGSKETVRRP